MLAILQFVGLHQRGHTKLHKDARANEEIGLQVVRAIGENTAKEYA